MEIKDLLILKKINFGILTLTVGLVSIFGLSVVASVLGSNPYKKTDAVAVATTLVEETAAPILSVEERKPASVAAVASSGAATLDFSCLDKKEQQSVKVTSPQLRIRAQLCGDFDISKTEITNTSNGYSAVVFKTGDKVMSSDYIQLSDGLNQIKIQVQDRLGRVQTSELLVSRIQAP